MSNPRPTREQLIALAKRDPDAIADLVHSLWSRVGRSRRKSQNSASSEPLLRQEDMIELLHRLDTRPCAIMGLFALPEAGMPYDNNQAERNLRMMDSHPENHPLSPTSIK